MFIVGHHDRTTSIIKKNLISSLKKTEDCQSSCHQEKSKQSF